MEPLPEAVTSLAARLSGESWVRDLFVAGSLATGDHVNGVSDLDLVAVVAGPMDAARLDALVELHRELDAGVAAGADLGCVYVEEARLLDGTARPPTWTHGQLVARTLSGITRAELVRHGFAVFGRPPTDLFPAMTDDDLREAARAELCGYWAWAARRPHLWWDPELAELGLTSMARGRHTLRTGQLLTKSEAIERAHAPDWLIDQMRTRRRGETVVASRMRTGWVGWRDALSTTRWAKREAR